MSHFYPPIHIDRCREALMRLKHEIIIESAPLDAVFAVTPEPVPYARRRGLRYRPIREGEPWGKAWDCGWFHLKGRVPKAWAGAYVTLRLDFGGETLVYDAAGEPMVGLTDGSVFDHAYAKDTVHLFPVCRGGEAVDFWVETGANTLFGVKRCGDPAWVADPSQIHGTHSARAVAMRVCRFDYEKWQLWLDLQVLADLQDALPETSARRIQILNGIGKALDRLATEGTQACREALKPVLSVKSDPSTVDVRAVGHAHIDTAWLWPYRETIRKCGRTFASQLHLIERYPGYVFGASQAQLYDYTRRHYPGLYARIKGAVAAGRWEVQGGMWVEADCILISGESMVRQFIHGKNYFRDEFGIDVKNLWLPDVFGYSGNLPQILRKSGIRHFLTQKISWNRHNKFPHNTFVWQGIDGSQVLAHFPPEDDYNSEVTPTKFRKNESNNQERGLVQEAICLFGMGDGGGGPKEEHIERGLRMRDLNGVPRFHFGQAQPVLDRMTRYWDELAVWRGELYLELHRGTLTTQAAMKRWNRRAEETLRAAEMMCAAAGVAGYPAAEFDRMWKQVLLGQFHDVIPGSSIHRVYEETVPMLLKVVADSRRLALRAAGRLMRRSRKALAVFNPSTETVATTVRLPEGWQAVTTSDGKPVPVQREREGVVAWIEAPGQRFVTLRRGAGKAAAAVVVRSSGSRARVLENARVRYEFDAAMRLVRGVDKETGVEIIPAGEQGNRLELFDDHPARWDAWDVEEYYASQRLADPEVETVERVTGDVRCGLRVTLRVGEKSVMRQQIWLGREGKRLDFVTDVDWREKHKLLRVTFPTTILTEKSSAEIQYGFVQRTTSDNTKWDFAQFECVGHRYADLSRHDYGVALLNDSKYGYRVKGHSLGLSLLRSPTDPDPVADVGVHQFTYSLLPHKGSLVDSDVRAQAAAINQGLELFPGLTAEGAGLPVVVTGEGIEMAVLKRAEKEDCLVVRVAETRGVPACGELRCANPRAVIVPTDMLEWNDARGGKGKGRLPLVLKPFEICTFKIRV